MLRYFSYLFSDLMISIITLDLYFVKRLLKPFVKKSRPKTILDLGCGSGSLAPLFVKSSYLGLDVDENLIEYAKLKHPGYKFLVKDATNFSLPIKFDMIFIVGVLHHLSDSEVRKTLKCVKKHIKQPGRIFIIEAILPIFRWNLIGSFLRAIDKGNYIRTTHNYKKFISDQFHVETSESKLAGLIDYAVITARN